MNRKLIFIILSLLIMAGGITILVLSRPTGGPVFYVAEAMLLLCLILLRLFYTRLIKPLDTIANGIDLLREQDFSSRLSPVGQPEADRIVAMFNGMMATLKEERLHVREQNHFLDLLIAASTMGIIILDDKDCVKTVNRALLRFIGAGADTDVTGLPLSSLPGPLGEALSTVPQGKAVTLRLSDAMIYRCSRLSFLDKGYAHPFIMVEQLTYEVIKAEKKAYEKVIRMMAHEVNNSMAGVNSLLDTISSSVGDPDIAEALAVCSRRCVAMSRFVTSFADVVKIPPAATAECDLNSFISEMAPLLESICSGRDITLRCETDGKDVIVSLDKVLMEQVLINLVKNSAESIGRHGTITVSTDARRRGFCVTDDGPGIAPETRNKIFTPFFSSKAGGHGLGLILVSDVLHKHGCTFSLRTGPDGLTRFTVNFPRQWLATGHLPQDPDS